MTEDNVVWEEKEKIWRAFSDDVRGLHIEASSQEELRDILQDVLPELVAANGILKDAGIKHKF